jgi:putative oxidoreductase
LQRLFSTFASGWPGVGLFLQRSLTAILLVRYGIIGLDASNHSSAMIPEAIGACIGILLLIGLWTPIAGGLIAVIELWIAVSHLADPWTALLLATLAVSIAMIGPGAWSVDALLFGRRHIAP